MGFWVQGFRVQGFRVQGFRGLGDVACACVRLGECVGDNLEHVPSVFNGHSKSKKGTIVNDMLRNVTGYVSKASVELVDELKWRWTSAGCPSWRLRSEKPPLTVH